MSSTDRVRTARAVIAVIGLLLGVGALACAASLYAMVGGFVLAGAAVVCALIGWKGGRRTAIAALIFAALSVVVSALWLVAFSGSLRDM